MSDALKVAGVNDSEGLKQYVTFSLNNEMYALGAQMVQEILELTHVTHVPHLPDYFRGVINLRGNIIPVMDMKTKFGMRSGEFGKHTCVIVTEFSGGVMGMIVDSVSDVLHLSEGAISDTPSFGEKVDTRFIQGMGKTERGLILVLDIEEVLSERDKVCIDQARAIAAGEELVDSGKGSDKEGGEDETV